MITAGLSVTGPKPLAALANSDDGVVAPSLWRHLNFVRDPQAL